MKETPPSPEARAAALAMSPDEFRQLGHLLVDRLADFLASMPGGAVTKAETPPQIQALLPAGGMPREGTSAATLLGEASDLVLGHSLFNGHPRFLGYIMSSAAPIGAFGDFLAATVNANAGAFGLGPIATEIEEQAIRWIADLVGYQTPESVPAGGRGCGGILVTGGNMANFVGFLVGRRVKAPWDVRARGMSGGQTLRIYASAETHTWLQKAADLFGFGTDTVRWIPTDTNLRVDTAALRAQIAADMAQGDRPIMVIGTAGTVSTGAIDPLAELAAIAREHDLWFHVDAAYGGFAACLVDAPADLKALALADSLAIDPHKWLYIPIEAGCVLVRKRQALIDTFRYRPPYYHFDERDNETTNFFEYGPQNTRGFRALKVWLALRQGGRDGYRRTIAYDIRLAQALYAQVEAHPELEAFTCGLSITTFRYVPRDLATSAPAQTREDYLNRLNAELVSRIQRGGYAYLSNAVIRGSFVLRACVVNFRTTLGDIKDLCAFVAKLGGEVDRELRSNGSGAA